ncbi:hypothetical protein RSAG8_04512, partial [Rhizoctonia solani AG-8 WAC10335]
MGGQLNRCHLFPNE